MLLNYTNGSPRAISGASLAQLVRRMPAPERGVLAADILDGRIIVRGLTAKAVAELCGVNQSYMFAALRLSPEERARVQRGERPLIPSRHALSRPRSSDWAKVDDGALVDLVRVIGIDRTLDAAAAAEHATAS